MTARPNELGGFDGSIDKLNKGEVEYDIGYNNWENC